LAMWDGLVEPISKPWNRGDYLEAVARGALEAGSLAVGVGEATAVVRGARAAHATNKAAVTTRAAETATVLKQTAKGADAAQGTVTALKGGDKIVDATKVADKAADASKAIGPAKVHSTEVVKGKTNISPQMEEKILRGQQKIPNKNEIIGGHSPDIQNANPIYAVETIAANPDGTKVVKYITEFPDGNTSKIKKSTLFPDSWSNQSIVDNIKKVGDMPHIGARASDGATLHRGAVNGVQIEVIKIGDNVTSGYPTGGGVTGMLSGFTAI